MTVQNHGAMRPSMQELIGRARRAIGAASGSGATVSDAAVKQSMAGMVPAGSAGAFHAHHLLRMQTWPDLRTIPGEHLEVTARVCAVLSRRRTTIHVLEHMLDLPRAQISPVLGMLASAGNVRVVGSQSAEAPSEPVSDSEAPVPTGHPPLRGMWRTLMRMFTHGK